MKSPFLIIIFCLVVTFCFSQHKKSTAPKPAKAQRESTQAVKKSQQPAATSQQQPGSAQTTGTTSGSGNGLAPEKAGQAGDGVQGSGEGTGPGSSAGVGLDSNVGDNTASSAGSPAIGASNMPDGTNTMQRATLNIAGSPLPGYSAPRKVKEGNEEKKTVSKKSKTAGKDKADGKDRGRSKSNRKSGGR